MFLRYKAENGALMVGAERSMAQCRRFDNVPELVACVAAAGSLRCRSWWFVTMTLVACDKDGRRTPGPSCTPSAMSNASVCLSFSVGFGADEALVFDRPKVEGFCD